jgi:hypothetical protein
LVIEMLAGSPNFFPSNRGKLKRKADAKGVAAPARDAYSLPKSSPRR